AHCAIALDATLAGRPAYALNNLGDSTSVIAVQNHFGRIFGSPTSLTRVEAQISNAGHGARGVVFGARDGVPGHYFNVENRNGVVRFMDGQTGRDFTSVGQNFIFYRLLRTN
ncbi:MAG: toxin glutamine deamidase domain-containing protein, partial [Kangiellaceae bacterium]|nr:toxin glutamine deamidase domain-containing protein [Kangiellaceae bacterium]